MHQPRHVVYVVWKTLAVFFHRLFCVGKRSNWARKPNKTSSAISILCNSQKCADQSWSRAPSVVFPRTRFVYTNQVYTSGGVGVWRGVFCSERVHSQLHQSSSSSVFVVLVGVSIVYSIRWIICTVIWFCLVKDLQGVNLQLGLGTLVDSSRSLTWTRVNLHGQTRVTNFVDLRLDLTCKNLTCDLTWLEQKWLVTWLDLSKDDLRLDLRKNDLVTTLQHAATCWTTHCTGLVRWWNCGKREAGGHGGGINSSLGS